MTDTITQWQIENLEALRIQAALAGPSLAAMQAYINGLEFELRSALAQQAPHFEEQPDGTVIPVDPSERRSKQSKRQPSGLKWSRQT